MFYAKHVSKVMLNTRKSRVLCGTGKRAGAPGRLTCVKNCIEAPGNQCSAVAGLYCMYMWVYL